MGQRLALTVLVSVILVCRVSPADGSAVPLGAPVIIPIPPTPDLAVAPKIIVIDNVPTKTHATLFAGNHVVENQGSPLHRGLSAVFIAPEASQTPDLRIELTRMHQMPLELESDVDVFELPSDPTHKALIRNYVDFLNSWRADQSLDANNSFTILSEAIQSLPDDFIHRLHIVEVYLAVLLQVQDYSTLKDFANTYLSTTTAPTNLSRRMTRYAVRAALLQANAEQEDYGRTITGYQKLVDDLEREPVTMLVDHLRLADLRATLGNMQIQYGRQRDDSKHSLKKQGFNNISRAIADAQKLGDLHAVANYKNMRWSYYYLIGQLEQARADLVDAINIHRQVGVSRNLADAYHNSSILHQMLGQFGPALSDLRFALAIEEQLPERSDKASLLLNIASLTYKLGRYEVTLVNANRARAIFEEAGNEYGAMKSWLIQARTLLAISEVSKAMQALDKATNLLNNRMRSKKPNWSDLAISKMELAHIQIESRAIEDATATFLSLSNHVELEKAIKNSKSLSIESLLLQLTIAVQTNDQSSFSKTAKDLDDKFSDQTERSEFIMQQLETKRLELEWLGRKGEIHELDTTVEKAIELITSVRNQISNQYLGPAWSAKANQILDQYVLAIYERVQQASDLRLAEQLFLFLETNYAVSFRESRYEVLQQAQQKEITPTHNISSIERDVATASSQLEREMAKQILSETQFKELDYQRSTKGSSPAVGLSISEIQSRLNNDEAVARFFLRETGGFVYLITPEKWTIHELPSAKLLHESARSFLASVRAQSSSKMTESSQLFQQLSLDYFDPVITKRLILVTSGILEALPLGAINSAPKGQRYRALEQDIGLVRTHSLSDLFFAEQSIPTTQHTNDIAIFADPAFAKHEAFNNQNSPTLRSWSDTLTRLPWTAREAESIVQRFPNKKVNLVMGHKATPDVLLSPQMLHSKVLHIASHGYFSNATAELVGIAAATQESDSSGEFGFVTLDQLLSKQITANLVVISGCETALGQTLNGEGLNGMTRGMLSRGAGSVIGTLWPIPDRPTAKFMGRFYDHLNRTNGDTASALSAAKRDFMKAGPYRKPFFWAGFVLYSSDYRLISTLKVTNSLEG